MGFISVNHGMNQQYHVGVETFEQATLKSVAKFKDVKVESIKVKQAKNDKNIKIFLTLSTTRKDLSFSTLLPKIENKIEEKVVNLIDGKPSNIRIQLEVVK